MSAAAEQFRAEVAARAKNRCEYCRLPALGQGAVFPLDHVQPESRGGLTDLHNLALACPRCNGNKWAYVDGEDAVTGQRVPLFNPRIQMWDDHFESSPTDSAEILGKTPIGRATVARLQMNHPAMLFARRMAVLMEAFGLLTQ